MSDPAVSVVIAAHDAADTIDRTLDSLAQQRCAWEAIVVDDRSGDATRAVVERRAAADPRIRLIARDQQGGASAARNSGLRAVRAPWVLFLDSDDELAPGGLDALLAGAGGGARWVVGGWERITPDGNSTVYPARRLDDAPAALARACAWAIHACLIGRPLVEAVGELDESLRTCEDWDYWQRAARVAGSPATVDEVVALYRVGGGSLSSDSSRMLGDGLRVIERGYQPPVPAHGMRGTQIAFAAYAAGLALGAGRDSLDLETALGPEPAPDCDPAEIAAMLSVAIPLGALTTAARWGDLATRADEPLAELLRELERVTGARALAARVQRQLLRLVALAADPGDAFRLGDALIADVDLRDPPARSLQTSGAARLQLRGRLEGELLAHAELPTWGADVPAAVALDALVEGASWQLLQRLIIEQLPGDPGDMWTAFLRELWDDRDASHDDFYDRALPALPGPAGGEALTVEVADGMPALGSARGRTAVEVTIGGMPFDRFVVDLGRRPDPRRLRATICTRGNLELVNAAMRGYVEAGARGEALALALRRLRDQRPSTADLSLADGAVAGAAAAGLIERATGAGGEFLGRVAGARVSPATGRMINIARPAAGVLLDAAEQERRPVVATAVGAGPVICAPGGAWVAGEPPDPPAAPVAPDADAITRGAAEFEALFGSGQDPWHYAGGYEQRKYEQTLELLPERVGSLLELACAEGHFTVQVAPRARAVTASDVSQLALQRARERCAGLENVSFRREDIFNEPIAGRWDAIVCSEVLYYAGSRRRLWRVTRSIARALRPGGVLVTAHVNLVVDAPGEPGFDWDEPYGSLGIADALRRTGMLALEAEIVTPMYRVQRWRRRRAQRLRRARRPESRTEQASPDLPADVRARFLPHGGAPVRLEQRERPLPVLMYHRVSDSGSAAGRRWRVTPDELCSQLDFLGSCGFTTITAAQWRDAVTLGAPLPERPLMLTFDDCFADFHDNAAAALERRGMSAALFCVTSLTGAGNSWDGARDPAPLMDWDQLRDLQARGFEIGAHSRSHRPLSALSDEQALDELAGSRLDITRELGRAPLAFAYPYGDFADGVRRLTGAAGFELAFSCEPATASRKGDLLAIPRVEVYGGMTLEELARKVASW